MAETKKLVIIKKEGKKALEVSKRLFDVYYKGLGYKKVEPEASNQVDDNSKSSDLNPDGIDNDQDEPEGNELPAYDNITKAEIVERLKNDGIDHNPRDSKEVLYALLEGE